SGTVRQVEEIMTAAGPARVTVDRPERPAFLLVLTHGAGGTPDTPHVLAVRDAARAARAGAAPGPPPYPGPGGRGPRGGGGPEGPGRAGWGGGGRRGGGRSRMPPGRGWSACCAGSPPAPCRCRWFSAAARTGRGSPAARRARSARLVSSRWRSRCTRRV